MSATAALRLDGELTIYRAAELKELLLAALEGGATLELDLGGVTELDSAGVQVLMLARQAAHSAGGALRLLAHSPAVLEVLELLDLVAWFDQPAGQRLPSLN